MSKPKARPKTRRPTPAATAPERRLPIGLIAGVIAAIAVIAVMVLSFGNSGSTLEVGTPQVEGTPLPPFAAIQGDAAVGMAAPTVRGADFDGTAVAIQPGDATAVVFLAHWCPHCQREVPSVQAWLDAGGGVPGVSIVSVATGIDRLRDNYPSSAWLEDEGWAPPVIVDDENGSAFRAFGGGGFPYWVFLDADGKVTARWAGELPIERLAELMEDIAP